MVVYCRCGLQFELPMGSILLEDANWTVRASPPRSVYVYVKIIARSFTVCFYIAVQVRLPDFASGNANIANGIEGM